VLLSRSEVMLKDDGSEEAKGSDVFKVEHKRNKALGYKGVK